MKREGKEDTEEEKRIRKNMIKKDATRFLIYILFTENISLVASFTVRYHEIISLFLLITTTDCIVQVSSAQS